ncbi:microcystin dependent MdpB family protein [Amylibacter marinus]|uniref:Microcystin dependent MdpB family protein n=2 Tax=Amylibacter marinus TaxID=1475483 RepID=A0ABQ5VRK1_9RHOB|nr:microcystin dependent MdpB family protein [Amylibacter marinus]
MFGGIIAPMGWAFCHGQLLNTNSNPALFAIIGTKYGGDGQSKFALPDLRGRVAVHHGQGPNLSLKTQGQQGGLETVKLTEDHLPAHNHNVIASGARATTTSPNGQFLAMEKIYHQDSTPSPKLNSKTIGLAGSNSSHTNIQASLVVNFIIALTGTFPVRS